MSITTIPNDAKNDRFANLRPIRAILRSDLRITRQIYQNEPVYVIHDPVSFANHRLPLDTYRIITHLGPGTTLGDVFEALVANGEFDREEEEDFYQLVTAMHQNGLLVLPFHDGNKLFNMHERMNAMIKRNKKLGFLFMQIPLSNPDEFLTRTAPRLAWIFSKPFLLVWLVGFLAAVGVVFNRFSEFTEPITGILATRNLPFLWTSLIVLKVWHEFGHGYACKVFGGRVPEMGTMLIAGNPLAYVDASSAWSFPEKRRRLVVMLGGMFFESLIAIPTVFIWATTTNPMLKSCTYNIIFTASVVTLLFNVNPLMKFDGYFILSELLGIQNLRSRSTKTINSILKRIFLGIKPGEEESADPFRLKAIFVTYGISSAIYRVTLVLSISLMIAQRFFLLGIGMAAFYILSSLFGTARKMTAYLWAHPETEPIRFRSRFVAVAVLCGIPLALCTLPMPFGVVTDGIIAAENEHYVRAETPGAFLQTLVQPGDRVEQGKPIATLENPVVEMELAVTKAQLQEAMLGWEILRDADVVESSRMEARIGGLKSQVNEMSDMEEQLRPVAPGAGEVVKTFPANSVGAYLQPGTTIAVIVDGQPILRAWLTEEELKTISGEVGSRIEFRLRGRSITTYGGRIIRMEAAAEDVFQEQALTFLGGGTILIDPRTGETMEPLFQLDIQPDANSDLRLADHGGRVSLRFKRADESIAGWAFRNCLRFLKTLRMA